MYYTGKLVSFKVLSWSHSLSGRIKAIQLDYTTAHRHLLQAIRKAPQSNVTAGFQQTTNKLFIIVQLLMGEIPERSVFRQATLRKSLVPYFHITQGTFLVR